MNPWPSLIKDDLNMFAGEFEKKYDTQTDRTEKESGQHKKRLVVFSEILPFVFFLIPHDTEQGHERPA